ncbi:MAG: hypothetical protein C5B52_04600 [Bacteroidetes bacterium]|nr:MAG: hypothetical protein C5B52_04600 [Bacteroidota bacterium]
MPGSLIYNHQIFKNSERIIGAENRSFRFGDGLFETMRVVDGSIMLAEYHFERLFEGINKMKFDAVSGFNITKLADEILMLCKKNKHDAAARVRLTVFRGDGSLTDPENLHPNYLIQTYPLAGPDYAWNETGLKIDIYGGAIKVADEFSAIKSNNFLPYVMASLKAKEIGLDECLLTNQYKRIADTSIANAFICKDGKLKTPALTEGCVAGVMRRFLLENFNVDGSKIEEGGIEIEEMMDADEVFLTNTVRGIRWVEKIRNKTYKNDIAKKIFRELNRKMR